MKREDLLSTSKIRIPEQSKISVFIDTDANNEADDQYAIMHFLLTKMFDIRGIAATHFYNKNSSIDSMEESYNELVKLLKLANIEDVSIFRGRRMPLSILINEKNEAAYQIIAEAKKNGMLYVCTLGALTNLAEALLIDETIADNITVVLNGGGPYPLGRPEFNIMQDLTAARIVFEKAKNIWQIPQNVYASLEVGLHELYRRVYPCGKIGAYLYKNLEECNLKEFNPHFLLRTGENWTLGDNAVVGVLLMNHFRENYHDEICPILDNKGLYQKRNPNKKIRVYDSIDTRYILEDFFNKLEIYYK